MCVCVCVRASVCASERVCVRAAQSLTPRCVCSAGFRVSG